ncbi:MAG: nuclear transport factor 2 family protein [Novosphingobium sp.]|nr:nuclear transport factor 2 family protein [Novosphingobium sp.]
MSRLKTNVGFAILAALATTATPGLGQDEPAVAAGVMALARAHWAAERSGGTTAQQRANVADDYTEFNQDYPTLLVGKAMAEAMLAVPQDTKPMFSDMQNPHVQVYGDTAILTYNFAGMNRSADGKINPATAKSTRVYVKDGGKWWLVHANFAPVRGPDD